jgi:hypothetical protein
MKFNPKEQIQNIFAGRMDYGLVECARKVLGDRSRPMRLEQLNSHEAIDIDEQRSPYAILKRALLDPDFNSALGESIEGVFTAAYEAYKPSWSVAFNQSVVSRLTGKVLSIIAVDAAAAVPAGKPYPDSAVLGADGDLAIERYGFLIKVTIESLINNDVQAMQRVVSETAAALRKSEDDAVFGELQTNATLFSSANGNLLTSATLDATNLLAATVKLRAMTAKGAKLRYRPGCLIVPSELERTAENLLANHVLVQDTGKMTLLVEPRLSEVSDADWYLAADKRQADSLVLQKLTGFENPQVQRIPNDDANFDGIVYRAKTHTAAAVVNPFGIVKCEA